MELFDFLATRVAGISTYHKDVVCPQDGYVHGLAPCSRKKADTRILLQCSRRCEAGIQQSVDQQLDVWTLKSSGTLMAQEQNQVLGSSRDGCSTGT